MPRMGNPSIQKIMFAHIALLGFQRAGGSYPPFSSRPLLYTAFPLLQARKDDFFRMGNAKSLLQGLWLS